MPIQNNYGLSWGASATQLDVELFFVRREGFHSAGGKQYGKGLFHHFKAAMSICFPTDDHHRWTDLILKSFCENEISVFMGCSDSTKTWTMSKIVLIDYWAAPNETLWAVSTSEGRGAELRFWGAIKDLFNQARERHPDLAGNPLDYLKCIASDSINEDEARSLRRGIIVIPCKTGGITSGLAPYIGIKAPRLRHAGDEVAVMNDSFLNAYANWYGRVCFRGMMAGNFMETDDPLGVAAEPEGGWDGWVDTGKTQTWKGRFYGANVVALDGRDSPNFDFPPRPNGTPHYPYLISSKKLDMVRKTKGEDSWEWFSQCVGKPVKGMDIWRVLSKDFCLKHHASEDAIWNDDVWTHLYALDPAYGLGDRCVGRPLKFGISVDSVQTLEAGTPEIIPIKINCGIEAEDQIAAYVLARLDELKIPYENCGFDSFGRGTLSYAFSKICGKVAPIPLDSSAKSSDRPVRYDLFEEETNPQSGLVTKRLKLCSSHYTKAISEWWFSARELIGAGQARGIDAETIREGCTRKFTRNRQNKIEVEPKEDMKIRLKGRSPDLMDNYAIGVEMARRLGFRITAIPGEKESPKSSQQSWTHLYHRRAQKLITSRQLQST